MSSKKFNIMVFMEGDTESIDTWSNIPYFLIHSLEDEGATIYKTDIGINSSSKSEKVILYFVDFITRCIKK